mmetsp:Transcript_30337/g.102361  ORF Transcript_30337/g.102361 Transcript_30337/m.102361 type:complete len:230 (+) Transcript_30337:225-914(+)
MAAVVGAGASRGDGGLCGLGESLSSLGEQRRLKGGHGGGLRRPQVDARLARRHWLLALYLPLQGLYPARGARLGLPLGLSSGVGSRFRARSVRRALLLRPRPAAPVPVAQRPLLAPRASRERAADELYDGAPPLRRRRLLPSRRQHSSTAPRALWRQDVCGALAAQRHRHLSVDRVALYGPLAALRRVPAPLGRRKGAPKAPRPRRAAVPAVLRLPRRRHGAHSGESAP